jgi:DNA (cytosine-5)-methyltransferase 1
LIENRPHGVVWHTAAETRRLLSMMSPIHRRKVELARSAGRRMFGAIYKRTRSDENGKSVQRAEIRFDGISGCLRTPVGGSSRQSILVVERSQVRSRLLSPREAARLMGLPDSYKLPENYNEAYHLAGDGVAVPVVRFLATHLLEPLLAAGEERHRKVTIYSSGSGITEISYSTMPDAEIHRRIAEYEKKYGMPLKRYIRGFSCDHAGH